MVVTWIILSLFPSLVRICRGRLRGGGRPVAWRAGDLGVVGVLVSRAGVHVDVLTPSIESGLHIVI